MDLMTARSAAREGTRAGSSAADAACLLCGGTLSPWLAMPIDPIRNAPSSFTNAMRCTACGVGSIRPLPAPAQIADFYRLDSYYTHGAAHVAEVTPSLAERLLIRLAWAVDKGHHFDGAAVQSLLPPGARVVDLGCGDGRLLRELAPAGFDVTGVEPDPAARALGAEHGLRILEGTAEDLPASLEPGSFDLVVMSHSLEHCVDPDRAIRNAAALLRPGGLFYCEVPNCAATHFRTFTITSTMFDAPRHLQFFTPENLAGSIESRGFKVEQRIFSGFTRQFHPGWRQWEATIWDRAHHHGLVIAAPRHGFGAALRLLARTVFAPPEAKYDCVGLLCRKT